jgi:hypothetical protein
MNSLIGSLNPVGNIKGGVNLPKGDKGDQGVSGVYVGSGEMPEGYNVQVDPSSEAKGVFPDLAIGVVETLEAGEKATASVTGPDDAPVLNLGIPRGAQGAQGAQGVSGVYVGDGDMPAGYSVQVNPNGDATTDKPWVLVESIKLTEDVTKIVPNFPANTYKELYIRGTIGFSKTDGSTNAITTYVTIGNVAGNISYVRSTTGGALGTQSYRFIVDAEVMPDNMPYFETKSSAFTSHMAGSGAQINYNTGYLDAIGEYLPPFSIYVSTANVGFITGTTLKIWGR